MTATSSKLTPQEQWELSDVPAEVVGGEYEGRQLNPAELKKVERELPFHLLPNLFIDYHHVPSGHRFRLRPYRFSPTGVDMDVDKDGTLLIG